MNRDEALKLIPPGWVECDEDRWCESDTGLRYDIGWLTEAIYAIPAPKSKPRRAEVVVELDEDGVSKSYAHVTGLIREWVGGSSFNCNAVANSKFRITIEEVLE